MVVVKCGREYAGGGSTLGDNERGCGTDGSDASTLFESVFSRRQCRRDLVGRRENCAGAMAGTRVQREVGRGTQYRWRVCPVAGAAVRVQYCRPYVSRNGVFVVRSAHPKSGEVLSSIQLTIAFLKLPWPSLRRSIAFFSSSQSLGYVKIRFQNTLGGTCVCVLRILTVHIKRLPRGATSKSIYLLHTSAFPKQRR